MDKNAQKSEIEFVKCVVKRLDIDDFTKLRKAILCKCNMVFLNLIS